MPIQNTGSDIKLRGDAADSVTDINEEINGNATDSDVSLGTLNTSAFTNVSDGSVVTGRAMSEMQGYSTFTSALPQTEADGALGESLLLEGNNYTFHRTPSLTSNRTTFTYSGWYKFNNLDSGNIIIMESGPTSGNGYISLRIDNANNNIYGLVGTNPGNPWLVRSPELFFDTSSWFHFVFAVDTTKDFINDRLRVYVNGIEIKFTYTANTIAKNQTFFINDGSSRICIGRTARTDQYAAYGQTVVADAKFIDGQQLRPDSFGELLQGIWIPKAFNTASTDIEVTSGLITSYNFSTNSLTDQTGSDNATGANISYYQNNYGIAAFNGSSSRIYNVNSISFPFSLGVWINTKSLGSTKDIYTDLGNGRAIYFRKNSTDKLMLLAIKSDNSYASIETSFTVKKDVWYHMVGVFNTNTLSLYVDGKHIATSPTFSYGTRYYSNNPNWGVSYSGSFSNWWDGYMADNKTWNKVISASEALQEYNATKHKYAYGLNGFHLPLNNTSTGTIVDDTSLKLHLDASNNTSYTGSGTTWSDLTSNSNNGTISGASFLSSTNGGVFDFDGSNDRVSLTNSLNSSTKAFEIWLNPDNFSADQWPFQQGNGQGVENYLRIYSSGVQVRMGNQTLTHSYTTANKWIHVVGTQKSGNGFEFYFNGVLVQETTNSLSSLSNDYFNLGVRYNAGYQGYFNGQIAQVRIYDKVLTAQEVITNYRATQGNYEQVSVVDISGNANSFTSTNIDATDHTKDQPLENYATLNNADLTTGGTISESGLKFSSGANGWNKVRSTIGVSSGKWYFEMLHISATNNSQGIGIVDANAPNKGNELWGQVAGGINYYGQNGNLYENGGAAQSYSSTYGSNTRLMCAFDMDAGKIWFGRNGTWIGDPVAGTGAASTNIKSYITIAQPFAASYYSGASMSFDFGQKDFAYTPPTGFKALATHNLPAPAFDPDGATPDKPSNYFKAVTYQGNGNTQGEAYGYKEGSRAAVFNGSSSYITTSLDFNTLTNYSISLWIYIQATPSVSDIFAGTIQDSGALNGFYLSVQTDRTIRFFERNSSTNASALTSTDTINAGSWNHILVVRNGSTNLLYINNGTAASTSNGTITHAEDFTIGRGGAHTSGLFEGKIDQVRIFNKALSSTEVGYLADDDTTNIDAISNQVAHYDMEGDANNIDIVSTEFATWDSTLSSIPNYSEGNLRMTGGSGNKIGYSTESVSSGKWYWEHEVISIGAESSFGIARPGDLGSHYVVGTSSTSWGLYVNGNVYHNSSVTTSGYMSGGFANGDIIGVELDLDNGTLEFYKNGTGYGNAFTGLSGEFLVAAEARTSGGSNDHRTNFGASAWDYTPSTGFQGLYLKYNGTASNVTYTQDKPYGNIDAGFAPDLVWIKDRFDGADHHALFDSVRGASKRIFSSSTSSQSGTATTLTRFDSNGFTLSSSPAVNENGNDFVAWCWKAAGFKNDFNVIENGTLTTSNSNATAGITAGSITNGWNVSANRDAGFSIVKYTGTLTSSGNISVGHGLSAAPELIISKRTDSTGPWRIRPFFLNNNAYDYLEFDTGALGQFSSGDGTMAVPTSTTFDNNWNSALGGAGDVIAYCFHSVDGFTKIGSYTGNGSSDGPFVYTGFKPAWIMVKNIDDSSNTHWGIFDNARDTNNSNTGRILANLSNAESTTDTNWSFDFLSNGFKVKSSALQSNSNGDKYIYMAFAEDPVKYSNGVATLGDGNEFIQDANYPEDNFAATTYTGNGGTQKITTGVDADLVWIKNRTTTGYEHFWWDSVRGAGGNKDINSDSTNYEGQENTSAYGYLSSFDSNGFTLTSGTSSAVTVNRNSDNYVAWNWKAAGHEYKSASFNGSSSKIEVSNPVIPNGASSISFWYNPEGSTGTEYILGQGVATASKGITVYWYNQSFGALVAKGTSSLAGSATGSTTYSTTTWHNVVFTWDGTSSSNAFKVYVNGSLLVEGTSDTSSSSIGTYTNFAIGGLQGGTFASGSIDQVRVFNKALSSSEVTTVYNETKNTVNTLQVLGDTSCIATYRLNGDALDLSGNYNGTESNIDYQTGSHFAYNIYENKARTFSHKASTLSLDTGTITPDAISANRDNGFSISKFTIPSSGSSVTVGHGLSSVPQLLIVKTTEKTGSWFVYTETTGASKEAYLELPNAWGTDINRWDNTAPTSSVFTLGSSWLNSTYSGAAIAYCWHSIPGFSKIGSYSGTGASGNKIVTGFEPAFLLIKNTTTGGTSWAILDNKRDDLINNNNALFANLNISEWGASNTTISIDFKNDGFILQNSYVIVNGGSNTYIYMAFAHR